METRRDGHAGYSVHLPYGLNSYGLWPIVNWLTLGCLSRERSPSWTFYRCVCHLRAQLLMQGPLGNSIPGQLGLAHLSPAFYIQFTL